MILFYLQKQEIDGIKGVTILYGTQTGTSKKYASNLCDAFIAKDIKCSVVDIGCFEPDDMNLNIKVYYIQ